MSDKKNDGGPVFPGNRRSQADFESVGDYCDYMKGQSRGMTLRDWFAGQAMSQILASDSGLRFNEVAADAYLFADAMLAERAKGVE